MAVCDFCNTHSAVMTLYQANETALTFAASGAVRQLRLSPDWAACPPCARLIDAGDRHGLLRRAGKAFGVRGTVATAILAATHNAFFAARRERAA